MAKNWQNNIGWEVVTSSKLIDIRLKTLKEIIENKIITLTTKKTSENSTIWTERITLTHTDTHAYTERENIFIFLREKKTKEKGKLKS